MQHKLFSKILDTKSIIQAVSRKQGICPDKYKKCLVRAAPPLPFLAHFLCGGASFGCLVSMTLPVVLIFVLYFFFFGIEKFSDSIFDSLKLPHFLPHSDELTVIGFFLCQQLAVFILQAPDGR